MRVLPIVSVGDKFYFHDERLKQYRNIRNPYDFIDYTDCEFCSEFNCPHTCHARCEFHQDTEIADWLNECPCGCDQNGLEEHNADRGENREDFQSTEEAMKGGD